MPPKNHEQQATHADALHSMAGSFLTTQGFVLAGDPGIVGRYGGSTAFYRSERGLSLSNTFDPHDGNAAWMSYGREWTSNGRLLSLSNNYSNLARRFGLDIPPYYAMGDREPQDVVVRKIVTDLKHSLPIVVSRLSLNDLLAVENEEPSGAAAIALRTFGESYSAHVEIRGFHGPDHVRS